MNDRALYNKFPMKFVYLADIVLKYLLCSILCADSVWCILRSDTRCLVYRLDSAPLSASLIADWLEVSGNMNIHDIEAALQQELDISSPILKHIAP